MEVAVPEPIEAEKAPAQGAQALNRKLIITALMLAVALSALDGTVVATAMPTIVGALGGLPLYSLVIAVYLLAATTTVPLYGKLCDMYGRKPLFLFGTGLFIVGSALCGLAWDMPSLIAFRAVQGLGAGAVVPVSLTLIGDLFSIDERARLQGVFSGVWGVSSLIGPFIGGAIVQFIDWRWVFFINVPVGLASAYLLFRYLRETKVHVRQKVDIAGAATLTTGIIGLLVYLQSGASGGWLSPQYLAWLAGGIVLLVIFGIVENRAAAPILSFGLLKRPVIAVPSLVGILSGGVLVGYAGYAPLIIQGAWGGTPIEAGLLVAPLSLGWPLASATSGGLLKRFGFRALAVGGTLLILGGTLLFLVLFVPQVSDNLVMRLPIILISTFIVGMGFGYSFTTMMIAVQNSVVWGERGIATASVQFFRNMGNTVGAAVLGALLTATLVPLITSPGTRELLTELPKSTAGVTGGSALGPVNALFDLSVRDTLSHSLRTALQEALRGSLFAVFVGVAVLGVLGVVVAMRFPKVAVE